MIVNSTKCAVISALLASVQILKLVLDLLLGNVSPSASRSSFLELRRTDQMKLDRMGKINILPPEIDVSLEHGSAFSYESRHSLNLLSVNLSERLCDLSVSLKWRRLSSREPKDT